MNENVGIQNHKSESIAILMQTQDKWYRSQQYI